MRRRLRQGCRWAWYACLASVFGSAPLVRQYRARLHRAAPSAPAHTRPRPPTPSTAHPLPIMSCIPFPRSLDLRVRARPRCHPTPLPSRTLPRRPARIIAPSCCNIATACNFRRCPTCRPLGYCAFLARWPRAQTRAVHVAARAQQHVAECGEREQR